MMAEKTAPREQGAAERSKTIKRLINSNFEGHNEVAVTYENDPSTSQTADTSGYTQRNSSTVPPSN